MRSLYEVALEPEVQAWLAGLNDRDFGRVDFLVGLLAEHAEDLGEPYARHLGGKVRELRFHLLRQQTRVTYWLAPGRRVILLTVFRKTRDAETAEIARALHAQKVCEAEHGQAHEVFDREVN
jgi:hypothetical protein